MAGMAQNKTQPTTRSVDAFLGAASPPGRREDGRALCALMQKVAGEPPVLWGPSIVGFGVRRYRYADGREGQICRIGFSPRTAALAFYLQTGFDGCDALMSRLDKHATSKACIYIRRMADVDTGVLEQLIARS